MPGSSIRTAKAGLFLAIALALPTFSNGALAATNSTTLNVFGGASSYAFTGMVRPEFGVSLT